VSDEGLDLVMPFLVCQSNGGPYDDNSFVAGVRFGAIDAELAAAGGMHAVTPDFPFPTPLVPQLDLLAMSRGYTTTIEAIPGADYEWATVTFTPEAPKEAGE